MFARGDSGTVISRKCTADAASIHNYIARQGIEKRLRNDKMIPLNSHAKYGRRFTTENVAFDKRSLMRKNSAPELHKPELPPIEGQGKLANSPVNVGRRSRPLTPLVVNSNRSQTTRSLPKNYRINLDLVPLVEVGTAIGNLPISRRRQTSLSSNDSSCFSSSTPSPRLQKKCDSPRPPSEAKNDSLESGYRSLGLHKRTSSSESLGEDAEAVDSETEGEGKDSMILRWLQTVEKSHEELLPCSTGELLPCIKEGKLA